MKLTLPPHKNYRKDIEIIKETIESGENITISKFCDGELSIIANKEIDNKEFHFDPTSIKDQESRRELIDAFQYKHNQYFVGITCVNVFGINTHRQMKMISGQPESNLTWADIWVNSNYPYFTKNILPIFSQRKTILVCNDRGNIENLPFKPHKVFKVGNSAFTKNKETLQYIKDYMEEDNIIDSIFLFCCGPFGNIIAHRLTEHNDKNTYLDIGSTLNPYLKSEGFKRDYYIGNNFFSNLEGEWDNG
jgi:hypothetical protein